MQQVTVGTSDTLAGAPMLVGRVDIDAGAKVLGTVTLSAQCMVGANAVMLQDVPPSATTVGVPERIVREPLVVNWADKEGVRT